MSAKDHRDTMRARELIRRADAGGGRLDVKLVADYLRREHRAWAKLLELVARRLRAGDSENTVENLTELVRQLRAGGARNMYGCLPCPQCGSPYRAAYKRGEDYQIECDECGLKQPGERADDPELGEGGAWNPKAPALEVVR